MSLTVRRLEQKAVIDLDGMTNPQELQESVQTLLGQSVNHISINFSNIQFVESSFLNALLLCRNLCSESHGDFNLFGLRQNIQHLVELTHLNTLLRIWPDEAQALSQLGASPN